MALYKVSYDITANGVFSEEGACKGVAHTMEVKAKPIKAGDILQGEMIKVGKSLANTLQFKDNNNPCLLWRIDGAAVTQQNTQAPNTAIKKSFQPSFIHILTVIGAASGVVHARMEKRGALGMIGYGITGALAGYGLGSLLDRDVKANKILNDNF